MSEMGKKGIVYAKEVPMIKVKKVEEKNGKGTPLQAVIQYWTKDEGGEILYDSEPEEGKPEWMLHADRASRKRHGIYS